MLENTLGIKVDVDTDRGTRCGVPNLLKLLKRHSISATFLFSLGPDNTGRAIKRIFRPGFFKKVSRTSVVSTYGLRTLMNGALLPAPHIGRRNEDKIIQAHIDGHEVGVHCYDHIKWQDELFKMDAEETSEELSKALNEFSRIFGVRALTAGSAGWQANANSLKAYDDAAFEYASDARGTSAFYPEIDGRLFNTMQIPTTLPTLDELLGRPEYPDDMIADHYLSLIKPDRLNILTVHAEMEGMAHLTWFDDFLNKLKQADIKFSRLDKIASNLKAQSDNVPVCHLYQGEVDGRTGSLAMQGQSKMNRV